MRKVVNNDWYKLTPLTCGLCIFAFFNCVLVNIVLILIPPFNWKCTVMYHASKFVLLKPGDADSWTPMLDALHYLQSIHNKPLYSAIFFEAKTKFQYPPTSLLPLSFLKNITPNEAAVQCALNLVSWVLLAIMIFFIIKIFDLSLRRSIGNDLENSSRVDTLIRNIALICLSLTFYPAMKAYSLGQIQTWLNSMFTIVFWCWMNNEGKLAGGLTGVMLLIKPQYLIIMIWGFLCRRWSFVISSLSVFLGGLLISLCLFGFANHMDYLKVLSYISKHGEAYYPNQSINGLLNRLFFNGSAMKWEGDAFAPFNIFVYLGTALSSAILVGLALLGAVKSKEKGNILDLAIVALSCTIASPVAWEHHYGILLPIYAFLTPLLAKQPILGKLTFPLLGLAYVLSSNYLPIFNKVAGVAVLNILQSYLLFASLLLLAYLYILKLRKIRLTNQSPDSICRFSS